MRAGILGAAVSAAGAGAKERRIRHKAILPMRFEFMMLLVFYWLGSKEE